jgi:hypothetical protein
MDGCNCGDRRQLILEESGAEVDTNMSFLYAPELFCRFVAHVFFLDAPLGATIILGGL